METIKEHNKNQELINISIKINGLIEKKEMKSNEYIKNIVPINYQDNFLFKDILGIDVKNKKIDEL